MEREHATRSPNAVAAVWGFAEATVFFLVPDVWLSYVALRSIRGALVACLYATAGAVVGGLVMYAWGALDPDGAVAMLARVPAVSDAMIERVGAELSHEGLPALFVGPFVGTPYKIYAAKAAPTAIGLFPFLLVSVPARVVRFALVSLIVGGIAARWFDQWSVKQKAWILTGFWILFYAVFLTLMPG